MTPMFSMQEVLAVLGIKEMELGYLKAELAKAQAQAKEMAQALVAATRTEKVQ